MCNFEYSSNFFYYRIFILSFVINIPVLHMSKLKLRGVK